LIASALRSPSGGVACSEHDLTARSGSAAGRPGGCAASGYDLGYVWKNEAGRAAPHRSAAGYYINAVALLLIALVGILPA